MQKIFSGTSEELNTELQNGWKFVSVLRSYKGPFNLDYVDTVLEMVENDKSKNGLHCSQEGFYTNEIVSKQNHQIFKSGDIVRIVHLPRDNASESSVGDIGILTDYDNCNYYPLKFNGKTRFTITGQYYKNGVDNSVCLELITDKIPEITIKDAIHMKNVIFEVTHDLAKEFQEAFFKTGKSWISGNTEICGLGSISMATLVINNDSKLCWSISSHDDDYRSIKLVSSEKKKHIHAKLMMKYAKLAQECEEPWKFVEFYTVVSDNWVSCIREPKWYPNTKYRIKK